uniref:Uncharacterized protein n=1 Tax=Spongospora subterranea TaxID=70186 RepID=A0A0H5QI34_9EUKA|eukprot:CRZ01648.1 hypothetical protein [Spongospora subterranea]
MGSCCSKSSEKIAVLGDSNEVRIVPSGHGNAIKHESTLSRDIDAEVAKSALQSARVKKLLLLGTGESGKSTLYRQMKRIYGVGFSKQELEDYKKTILANTVAFMLSVLKGIPKLQPQTNLNLDINNVQFKNQIGSFAGTDGEYNLSVATAIVELWKDPAIRNTFEYRSQLQVPECAKYFFDKALELADPNYVPSDTDILMSRVRTTGILETRFKISGTVFDIFDVGGQRNERKKWIHCFDSVTGVIFVIALSEYDQMLFEDEKVNRMVEALQLFEETVNSKWFSKVDIIVFLNKMDLLMNKIVKVPVSDYFPDYTGGLNAEAAANFFKEQVLARNHTPMRGIYCHMTNATDEANVIHVFSAVRDIVLRKGMAGIGLL